MTSLLLALFLSGNQTPTLSPPANLAAVEWLFLKPAGAGVVDITIRECAKSAGRISDCYECNYKAQPASSAATLFASVNTAVTQCGADNGY